MEITGVYKITNLINGKFYIGSSSYSINYRIKTHIQRARLGKHENSYIQRAWNKYGEENFSFEILEECNPNLALEREQYYLNTLLKAQEYINGDRTFFKKYGYNLSPTASSTYGVKQTDEQRLNHIIASRLSVSNPTEAMLANWEKMRQKNRKSILQFSLEGEFIKEWYFIKDAAIFYNVALTNLSCAAKNTNKTVKNFIWIYAEKSQEDINEELKIRIEKKKKPVKKSKIYKDRRTTPVLQYDKNGNFIKEWNTLIDAAKSVSTSPSNIMYMCKGERPNWRQVKGYVWKYKSK